MEGHFYSEVAPKGIEHEPYYDASLAFKMLLEIGCNPDIPDATPSPLQRPLDGLAVLPPGDISLPFPFSNGTDAEQIKYYDYLLICVEMGNTALLRFVIEEAGVDPDCRLGAGKFVTVLAYAAMESVLPTVELLLELGADPRKKSNSVPAYSAIDAARMGVEEAKSESSDEGLLSMMKMLRRRMEGLRPKAQGHVEGEKEDP